MASRRRTAFERYAAKRRAEPAFERAYLEARDEITIVDEFVRALDRARIDLGMSKAELARRIGSKPEIVRRLLTSERANPTLKTVVMLAGALGLRLELLQVSRRKRAA
ncbi:MAG TPA: helix-turn-helix domain-containing protein [Polyangiaceae bacterium]